MESIAIITDIHGNYPALRAVLNDISESHINHIYCLGDVVGIGPDSNQVFELLTSRTDISFVAGNHDLAVSAAFHNEPPPRGHHNERAHHQWLAERIDPSYIQLIDNWPRMINKRILDTNLYFCHYHLEKDHWFSTIDKFPTAESLDLVYAGTEYNLVCFGHRHIVHHFQSGNRIYFNPGSLGCNHKPTARYGVIQIDKEDIGVELKEVPYNNEAFLKSYEELKVPEREFILKAFYGIQ